MTNRDQSLAVLKSLDTANIFVDSYYTNNLPHDLDIFFGPPDELFLAPEYQFSNAKWRLVPLLDDGNFGIVTFYCPTNRQFIQFNMEDSTEPRAVFDSWQQYLASLFIRIAEAGIEDEQLSKIAEAIGFKHFEKTLSFLDSDVGGDWEERFTKFIASI